MPDRGARERGKKTHPRESLNNPLQSQQGRGSTGRESAQLLNVTHFSREFSNTIEPEQENRNILLFHEQHNQTTVLANQHCVWRKKDTPGNTSRITPLSFTATDILIAEAQYLARLLIDLMFHNKISLETKLPLVYNSTQLQMTTSSRAKGLKKSKSSHLSVP